MSERSGQAGDSVSEAPLISGLSAEAHHPLEKLALADVPNLIEVIVAP